MITMIIFIKTVLAALTVSLGHDEKCLGAEKQISSPSVPFLSLSAMTITISCPLVVSLSWVFLAVLARISPTPRAAQGPARAHPSLNCPLYFGPLPLI